LLSNIEVMFRPFFFALIISASSLAAAAGPAPLLPKMFAGWEKTASERSNDAGKADAANAGLLREYGFTDTEIATYTRDDEKLHLRAARFTDATGALGTYSFYLKPEMADQQIGDRAAALGDHILLQRANLLIDASFEHPSAMSAAELRELAAELPAIGGGAATPPSLISDFPSQGQEANSMRYVVGPIGLAMAGATLPSNVVDFSRSAEVATAQYRVPSGIATLTVVSYPTPQIAVDHERALVTWVPSKNNSAEQQPIRGTLSIPTADGRQLTFRRSGPLLVFVSGNISSADAHWLAQSVNYRATVTWNQPAPLSGQAVGGLIVGIFVLIALLLAIFLVIMIFFGGSFVLMQRLFPNRQILPAQRDALIKLNLKD